MLKIGTKVIDRNGCQGIIVSIHALYQYQVRFGARVGIRLDCDLRTV